MQTGYFPQEKKKRFWNLWAICKPCQLWNILSWNVLCFYVHLFTLQYHLLFKSIRQHLFPNATIIKDGHHVRNCFLWCTVVCWGSQEVPELRLTAVTPAAPGEEQASLSRLTGAGAGAGAGGLCLCSAILPPLRPRLFERLPNPLSPPSQRLVFWSTQSNAWKCWMLFRDDSNQNWLWLLTLES